MSSCAGLPIFGPFIQVGDKEGNQDAGTDTCHRSCRDLEGASEPSLETREGFSKEECSGDRFGIGLRMRSTGLTALGTFHTKEELCKGPRGRKQSNVRTAGGILWVLELRGVEVIRQLDQGS